MGHGLRLPARRPRPALPPAPDLRDWLPEGHLAWCIQFGSEERDDVALYLIHAEIPSMAEHSAHDPDPRFMSFLQRARKLQPEPPSVFGEDIIFQRG